MAGLEILLPAAIDPELPYDNTVAVCVNKLKHMMQNPLAQDLADALETLQNTVDHLQLILRGESAGEVEVTDAAAARADLDVYSKAEVYTKAETDAAIAAALSAMVINSAGDHDHTGAVPVGGIHSHTHT